jgi:putative membrane protein
LLVVSAAAVAADSGSIVSSASLTGGGKLMRGWAIGESLSRLSIRTFAHAVVRRRLIAEVQGLEHLPPDGPTILVARHYHHLYDAALLLTMVERPLHFLVALDWVASPSQKLLMETACRAARWPTLLRPASFQRDGFDVGRAGPYAASQVQPYLRRALTEAHNLLCAGRLLVVFPEGYPNIDPSFTPKSEAESWLPFSAIFARIAARAERSIGHPVPIVPAGLVYEPGARWHVTLRLGSAITLRAAPDRAALTRQVESAVVELSTGRGLHDFLRTHRLLGSSA